MPMGSVWASGSWANGAWANGSWADVGAPASPHIVLTPSTLNFSATVGGGNPATQQSVVSNSGTGTVTPVKGTEVTDNGGAWLSGSLVGNTLTVTCTTGALAAGVYTGRIPISSTGADNTPQNVEVVFEVAAAGGSAGSGLVGPASNLTSITQIV